MTEQHTPKPLTVLKWTLLTWAGWAAGIALIIGLGTLNEAAGISPEGQSVVGIGMGAGVGFMQWLALRKHVRSSHRWIWFSILGFSIAYILCDVILYFAGFHPDYFIILGTAAGALITGWLQYKYILRDISPFAKSWIAYCFLAWMLAHLLTMGAFLSNFRINDYIPRFLAITLAFIFILIGGPLLGFISGRRIVFILNRRTDAGMTAPEKQ
jgi:hypothetical protein